MPDPIDPVTQQTEALYRVVEAVRNGSVPGSRLLAAVRAWLENPSSSTEQIARVCLGPAADSEPTQSQQSQGGLEETALYVSTLSGSTPTRVESSLSTPRTTLPSPGRYRIIERLAVGGLGIVERAWDSELGREVALKRLRPDRAADPNGRARFLREGWITAGLEHPGIVPVHGRGRFADGQLFFAMRLVRGRTLRQAIHELHGTVPDTPEWIAKAPETDRDGPPTLRGLIRRLRQACEAVEFAHSRGVIHRDLKPQNILLGPFGETLVVDWGLAKSMRVATPMLDDLIEVSIDRAPDLEEPILPPIQGESSIDDQTSPGAVQGTIPYMSPEQARGDLDRIGPLSDVYSLGATLYCTLAGRPPISVEGRPIEALARVTRGDFQAPRAWKQGVDSQLEAICLKAMAHDPAARYPSAGVMAEALEDWLAEERAESVRQLFSSALSAYGTLVFTVQKRLRPIRAAHAIREDLLNRAVRGLEQLVEHAGREHADDIERSLASAYEQIADLQQQLGRTAEARRNYERSLHSLDSHMRDHDPREYAPIGVTLGKLGDVLRRQGELAGAREYYLRSLELTRSMAGFDSNSTRDRRGLEIILGKLSSLSRQMGDIAAARAYQEESLAISRALLELSPDDLRAQRGLAISLGRLGDVCRDAGDLEIARSHYQQSVDICRSLLQRHPSDLHGRRGLAIASNKLAEVCRLTGDLTKAREAALEGLRAAEMLSAEDPWSVPARHDLAIAASRLGEIERQAGELAEARRWFSRSLEQMQSLVDTDPDDAQARRGLLLAHLRLGEVLHHVGELELARESLNLGLAIAEALALAEALDAQAQLDVAHGCLLLGRLERDSGQNDRAVSSFLRGRTLLLDLQSRHRLSPSHQHLLAELEADVASLSSTT